jgi:hypothetical protein
MAYDEKLSRAHSEWREKANYGIHDLIMAIRGCLHYNEPKDHDVTAVRDALVKIGILTEPPDGW